MRTGKERLTVTVDPYLVEAGNEAVEGGRAESLSAWVNRALSEWVVMERRRRALGEAVAAYEAEFGSIGPEELAAQARADRASARVLRGTRARPPKGRRASRRGRT
jgi:Arc/MetJ-type ribon-helix-helix transcriptional regulator